MKKSESHGDWRILEFQSPIGKYLKNGCDYT